MLYTIYETDWDFETDGIPQCFCDTCEEAEEVILSPQTGDKAPVGMYGAIALMFVAMIVLGRKGRK